MSEPWRDRSRKRFGQMLDAIGDFAQAFDVLFRLTATFFVCNNFASLAQGRGELAFGACHEKERKLETATSLAQASAVSESGIKRILIADDDSMLGRLMREALTTRLGCEVDATSNPEYAFELALKKRSRVFVFDFCMPMIDGAMLFALISKVYNHVNPPLPVPPLILISGKGDEERAQELMRDVGVRGFLAKPFAMNRLIEKVREVAPEIETAA
jgi:CheY-like chemotaxis protein